MKKAMRLLCLIFAFAFIFTIPAQGVAINTENENKEGTTRSAYFGSSCVYLVDNKNCSFDVWFEVTATRYMDKLGASHIKIQESLDGTTWTTVRNCYPSSYPDMLATDAVFHASSVHYTGMQGRYYRAVITLYAENASGTGQVFEYTQTLRLQYA